ncbi:MAG: glycosyltransferase family 2 protein [SAR324 cluster bacterium]|nr:glycosyltransferase family 2 protein [SAR324 cluster bacterium]
MSHSIQKNSLRILIILPCFNEGAMIGDLLHEISKLNPEWDTLVVDDCSTDHTYKVASAMSPCVKLVANLGIGGAVQTAIKYAFENDYDLCLQVDGDGQHPPDQIRILLNAYLTLPFNIIIGSRFIEEIGFQSTPLRRVGIQFISKVISWCFKYTVTDPTSGFRLMDRKAIQLFSLEYPLDFPEPVSLAIASEAGLSIKEVPVIMKPRRTGTSSITGLKTVTYMLRVIGYLFLIRIARHI